MDLLGLMKVDIPHRITQSELLHILQILLSELSGSLLVRFGFLLLPLALGLRITLEAADLLENRQSGSH